MKAAITLTLFILSLTGWAKNKPCELVKNFVTAKRCFKDYISKSYTDLEGPNSVGITNTRTAFRDMKSIAKEGGKTTAIKKINRSDYLAVVMRHESESHLYYLILSNGKNVVPEEMMEINMVEIEDIYPKNGRYYLNWSLHLRNIKGWPYDEFQEIAKEIKEDK